MERSLVHSEDEPSYSRLPDETAEEYEAFCEWARIPPSARNMANLNRRSGIGIATIKRLMLQHHWEERTLAFDHDSFKLAADAGVVKGEVSPEWQISLGQKLIDIGITGLEAKDPTLINVDKLRKLIMDGAELKRKGQGLADLTITVDSSDMSKVNELLAEVIDVEAFDEEE